MQFGLQKNCYAGEGFGELAIKYDCPRSFTAVAQVETNCLYVRKKIYKQYVKDVDQMKKSEEAKEDHAPESTEHLKQL